MCTQRSIESVVSVACSIIFIFSFPKEYLFYIIIQLLKTPINRALPLLHKDLIHLAKMLASEKSSMGRKWRWMNSLENGMFVGINQWFLTLSIGSPEQKH